MTTKVVLFIVAIAAGVFAFTLVHAVWYAPDIEVSDNSPVNTSTKAPIAGASTPLRLSIPKLSIDANVQRVGIAKSGSIGIPSNFTDVAWYKYGSIPGEPGTAVIDGHVDNALSLPGVFKHLSDIAVGDDIYVETASSTSLHFVVSDVEVYPYQDVPMDTILNKKGSPALALITCDGTWVQSVRSYDERLVVYATLES
jgi:LPXTG-site transpeptidase (sortase) family protein